MPRQLLLAAAAASLPCVSPIGPAAAFTDQEVEAIFRMFDSSGDGKITREEYSANIVTVIYRNIPQAGAPNLTFEQTRLSRAFFDAADVDHDGTLEPVEIMDALPFEAADRSNMGYLDREDVRSFLARIGR